MSNEFFITEYEANQRLDKFLRKYFNEASAGFVHKMLRKKRIKLNGNRAAGDEMLACGDRIKFYISPETMEQLMSARVLIKPKNNPVDIVYEDENILALNKPCGVLTHPAKGGAGEGTLIDNCLAYLHNQGAFLADKNSVFTPAFCNRLDRNTTGLILCGKNPAAMRELNRGISERCIDKYYLALVVGEPKNEHKIISYHQKNEDENRALLSHEGKEMVTGITILASNRKYSLLSVKLVTGRSHQIRAQLSAIGNPIAGDGKYGGKISGVLYQILHAERIVFNGLTGCLEYLNTVEIYVPPDRWFDNHVQKLMGEKIL